MMTLEDIRNAGENLTGAHLAAVEKQMLTIGGAYELIALAVRLQHPEAAQHACPPDHGHAINFTCYNAHHCRCTPCRDHINQRRIRIRKLRAYGRWEPFLVPATGTRRRLEALMAIGWSQSALAAQLGTHQSGVWQLLFARPDTVERPTFDRIRDLYERLWDTPPATDTACQRGSKSKALACAARHNFQPPLAWDDIDTDTVPAEGDRAAFVDEILVEHVCDGGAGKLNVLERRAAIRILNARGMPDGAIAERLGLYKRSVLRIRSDLGIPAAVGADNLPIAS